MKHLHRLYFLLLFSACQTNFDEAIISIRTNQPVLDLQGKAPLTIGQTHQSDISTITLDSLKTEGLELVFGNNQRLEYAKITSPAFVTRRGLGVGAADSTVIDTYGQPKSRTKFIAGNRPKMPYDIVYDQVKFTADRSERVSCFYLGK